MGTVRTGIATRVELWNAGAKSATVVPTTFALTSDSRGTVRQQAEFTAGALGSIVPTTAEGNATATYGQGNYGDGTYGGTDVEAVKGLLLPAITDVKAYWAADGVETLIGQFRCSQVVWTRDRSGVSVDVTAYGVARRLQKAGWDRPFPVGGVGKTVGNAIKAIIADRAPGVPVTVTGASDPLPAKVLGTGHTSNPWSDIQDLAVLSGCEVFDDIAGGITVQPVPDLTAKTRADAQWTFTEGRNGVIVRLVDTQDDEQLVNTVVVTGRTKKGKQYKGVAQILNPDSAWTPAKVGEFTQEYSSSSYTSAAQCQNAANAALRALGGLQDTLEVDIVPNPDVRVGDLAWVQSGKLGIKDLFVVTQLVFDATPGTAQTLTCVRVLGG